jgi:leader peptidase (prepilin peptidase)/N-methyltransferase
MTTSTNAAAVFVAEPRQRRPVHPLVVVATLPAAAVALLDFGFTPRGSVAAFFLATLAVLSVVDIRERRLPNAIVVPSAAFVLVAQMALFPDRAIEWVLASGGTFLALLLLALLYPAGMGMGDVKLGLLLGAGLGSAVPSALLVAFLAGGVAGVALIAKRGAAARKSTIPFGPFLAFGAAVVLLLAE